MAVSWWREFPSLLLLLSLPPSVVALGLGVFHFLPFFLRIFPVNIRVLRSPLLSLVKKFHFRVYALDAASSWFVGIQVTKLHVTSLIFAKVYANVGTTYSTTSASCKSVSPAPLPSDWKRVLPHKPNDILFIRQLVRVAPSLNETQVHELFDAVLEPDVRVGVTTRFEGLWVVFGTPLASEHMPFWLTF